MLNAYFSGNMSVSEVKGQMQVKRCEFGAALSEEMLEFVNTRGTDVGMQAVLIVNELNGHSPVPVNHQERVCCIMCKLQAGGGRDKTK